MTSSERSCIWLSDWRLIGSTQRKLSTKKDSGREFWRAKLTASLCGSNKSTHWLSWKVCGNTYIMLGLIVRVRTTSFVTYFIFPSEHEACIRDVTELKRQLALDRDKLDQAQEKLSHAKVLNQRLHQEISSAKTQIPVVKESLELQRGIITWIKAAQAEVRHVASQQTSFGFTSHLGHVFCSGLLLQVKDNL